MNPDIAERWARRLEITPVKMQTTGRLFDKRLDGTNCYCALGLLTEIYREQNPTELQWVAEDATSNSLWVAKLKDGALLQGSLPLIVRNWAEMHTTLGALRTKKRFQIDRFSYMSVSSMNDCNVRWPTIAEQIRANKEWL